MECDICGAKDELVKVRNEDGDNIYLCQSCYETQFEGYEKSAHDGEEEKEDWEDDDDLSEEDEDFDDEEEEEFEEEDDR